MNFRQRPQPLGCLLCCQVALGFGQHLVADHELFHSGRAQQGRVKVGVQLPVRVLTIGVS